jgi:hypothetical protein
MPTYMYDSDGIRGGQACTHCIYGSYVYTYIHTYIHTTADEMGAFRSEEARLALIGVARDLRGIVAGSTSQGLAHVLFDVLHPAYFPVCIMCV